MEQNHWYKENGVMQIRELVSSGSFSDLKLLTGEFGLDTDMKDVVLLEYESLKQEQQDYYQGDFIISTLYFAKDNPDEFYAIVDRLITMGAAGLAFKTSYYKALPEKVLVLAQEKGFPIFMFDDIYIEDVILTISDYLRLRQEFSMYEEPLFKILSGASDNFGIEQLCANMNPNRQKFMNAVYVHAPQLSSDWSTGLRSALQLRTSRKHTGNYRLLQFRRGFFILSNYTEPIPLQEIGNNVVHMLSNLGCDTSQLCFGVSRLHQRSVEFDCVIREAFDALLMAISDGSQIKLYPDLKLYQSIFAMLRDKSLRLSMAMVFKKLEQYDKESNSGSLLSTLKCHAQTGYDIKKTAEALDQHPNTIRYRLKKICDLTASPAEANHALFLMGEYIRMDELGNSIF